LISVKHTLTTTFKPTQSAKSKKLLGSGDLTPTIKYYTNFPKEFDQQSPAAQRLYFLDSHNQKEQTFGLI